ncbi:MAG TPA: TonB-dependent receptor [Methylococcaceae bacterium]|jgi:vitamin B12 transporter|nr:TonB-dependent receptor [Methylococcaceae bacterium]
MKPQALGISYALLAVSGAPLSAETGQPVEKLETVVVTATRTETPEKEIGSAITVITAQEIASRKLNSVADVLRVVPGLDVVRAGGAGQQTSVFLRGANANLTLVLIDGVEMNDPASPNGAFNFSDLQTDNIERIEILRGAGSAIYGSDPIGGVINIITKKGQGKPKFQAMGEGGSYDTFKVRGGVTGGTDRVNYNLSASRLETGGFSAADSAFGNSERDSYKNSTVSARLGAQALDNLDFGWTLRYNEGKAMIDTGCNFVVPCDDPNSYTKSNALFTRGHGHLQLFDGFWEQTLGLAYSRTDRHSIYKVDRTDLSYSRDDNLGEKIKVDWQNVLHVHETNTVTLGIEDDEDRMASESTYGFPPPPINQKTMNDIGFYLQDQIRLFDRWFTTAGVRHDENNRFGGHVTWRANQVFAVTETGTRIKGSYGTGFKAPSLLQLFDPTFGNPDLKPETSRNWDIGLEQSLWRERIQLEATYFNNSFENLIKFGPPPFFKPENIGQATAEGVEGVVEFRPLEDLSLRGTYTYTRTKDQDTGQRLLRRPTHKGSFDADYRFLGKAAVHLNILMVGDKDDILDTRVPGYVLVNLAGSYDVSKNLQIFARVDNLFDKKYEEVFGFGTSGIAGYGGVTLSYD